MEQVLHPRLNYIVSGLERSGTSMLMQMLRAGELPVAFDKSRPSDSHNPKGYYELEGGKIINKLMEGTFPFEKFKGQFIKITAYGMKFLPPGQYKIIYSERSIEEILDSMEKMADINDQNRGDTKAAFLKLNALIKQQLQEREDVDVLFVNYNEILSAPKPVLQQIQEFLQISPSTIDRMIKVIDHKLYRQRRATKEQVIK
jgi:hypothetical protein